MVAPLALVTKDLHEQWELLRAWLDELPDDLSDAPSSLPGWSVADLVAHLGRSLDALKACEPQPADTEPITLGEYLGGDAPTADRMSTVTKELARTIAGDPLGALDELAEKAFARLDELSSAGEDAVVLARRGPILLRDFAMTRLIELVVHAYDLARELPLPVPVDPTARTLVAEALLDVLRRRSGADVVIGDETAWVKLASGRLDWAEGVARTALRPGSLSDGTPDLSGLLPLL